MFAYVQVYWLLWNVRCCSMIWNLPGLARKLIKLNKEYCNTKTLLSVLLKWMIEHTVTLESEAGQRLLLNEVLCHLELENNFADSVTRY